MHVNEPGQKHKDWTQPPPTHLCSAASEPPGGDVEGVGWLGHNGSCGGIAATCADVTGGARQAVAKLRSEVVLHSADGATVGVGEVGRCVHGEG